MTYQLIMRGRDGIVLASDRREVHLGFPNQLRKIRVDKTGKFAWAYSGPRMVATFSRHIVHAFESAGMLSDESAAQLIAGCAPAALKDASANEMPGSGDAVVILVSGPSKRIFRAVWRPVTEAEEIFKDKFVAGQSANLASFFPHHFHSPKFSVDELCSLAAYSIRMANHYDPQYVDGLDIAVFRDSVGRFEFEDDEFYWAKADELDKTILQMLISIPRPNVGGNG